MWVVELESCPEFEAVDGCLLREWLHPHRGGPPGLPYSVASARVPVGGATHRHVLQQTEVYLLLQGQGRMHVAGEQRDVRAGEAVVVPAGQSQWIENSGTGVLHFLALCAPPWRAEDDRRLL